MSERFRESVKKIVGKFVDLRSNEEIQNAHAVAEQKMARLTSAFMRREISDEEYNAGVEAYLKNPDAGIDLRRTASKLKSP